MFYSFMTDCRVELQGTVDSVEVLRNDQVWEQACIDTCGGLHFYYTFINPMDREEATAQIYRKTTKKHKKWRQKV